MYCIYLRKSRKDAELEAQGMGETLARHRRTLTELAAARGLPVGRVYEEIVSGDTIAARPQIQALLHDVEEGLWQGVITMEVERLARGDSIDQGIIMQTLAATGTVVVTPAKTYDPSDPADSEYFEFALFMARREYKAITRRMQAGREASAREGNWLAAPPYGYTKVRNQRGRGMTLDIREAEADVVRMIYNMRLGAGAKATGAAGIASALRAMGIRSPAGAQWCSKTVLRILQNPAYVGMVVRGARRIVTRIVDGHKVKEEVQAQPQLYEGKHPPIITRETWDGVQLLMSREPHKAREPMANPLAGLLVCDRCGHKITRKVLEGTSTGVMRCKYCTGEVAMTMTDVLEDAVLSTLEEWQAMATGAARRKPKKQDTSRRDAARRQVDTLNGQLSRMRDLLEQGVYDVPTYLERQADITARLDAAKQQLEDAANALNKPTEEDKIVRLLPQLTTVLNSYATAATAAERNALLRSVIDRVIYRRPKGAGHRTDTVGLELDVWPRYDGE